MGTDPAWGGKGLAAGKSGCFQELGGGFRQFVNTDRKERGEQAAEHEAAGPAVLKLPRERQGIPAPCIKAPEERAAFAPSSLYLERESLRTHLCKPD